MTKKNSSPSYLTPFQVVEQSNGLESEAGAADEEAASTSEDAHPPHSTNAGGAGGRKKRAETPPLLERMDDDEEVGASDAPPALTPSVGNAAGSGSYSLRPKRQCTQKQNDSSASSANTSTSQPAAQPPSKRSKLEELFGGPLNSPHSTGRPATSTGTSAPSGRASTSFAPAGQTPTNANSNNSATGNNSSNNEELVSRLRGVLVSKNAEISLLKEHLRTAHRLLNFYRIPVPGADPTTGSAPASATPNGADEARSTAEDEFKEPPRNVSAQTGGAVHVHVAL